MFISTCFEIDRGVHALSRVFRLVLPTQIESLLTGAALKFTAYIPPPLQPEFAIAPAPAGPRKWQGDKTVGPCNSHQRSCPKHAPCLSLTSALQ
jgi:hypothetical protein